MKKEKIFIIIPGLNEEKHIFKVVKKIKKQGFENVLFVDDGSKDKSGNLAEKAGATVLRHIINMGKGAAAKTGCDYALKEGADVLILMDADGQHKPEDLPLFIKEIKNKDIVFGYRKLNKKMPAMMRIGNWGINLASRIINGIDINDTQSGFRCMTADAYNKIRWSSNDYSMESEMVSNVAKNKLKYAQIPIDTIYHDTYKGTTVADGIRIFIRIIKFKIFKG
jgi:UDP-N-acetylglucosamine---dolichyl-phosphate N-acetylglucosaminyltransferase